MPKTPGRIILVCLATASLVIATVSSAGAQDHEPVRVPPPSGRLAGLGFSSAASTPDASSSASSRGSWWLGTSGIALALAACGAAAVAARRYRPPGSTAAVGVVGKVSLSPRHSIVLVRAGSRVLLVGTGPQGAPSLLGELEGEAIDPTGDTPHRPGGDE
ncbi:flagellar biosynthetic protein FliO [Aquisphaera insulae]|uniref:flagellar biosynthetic protein FliO n=1 Tax=Aquisphaera insulae TaxID=2712864 RepID=UPI0013EAF846|nr:flagellar biosynthetic protein FliO [Aquisphaera insulae]